MSNKISTQWDTDSLTLLLDDSESVKLTKAQAISLARLIIIKWPNEMINQKIVVT